MDIPLHNKGASIEDATFFFNSVIKIVLFLNPKSTSGPPWYYSKFGVS